MSPDLHCRACLEADFVFFIDVYRQTIPRQLWANIMKYARQTRLRTVTDHERVLVVRECICLRTSPCIIDNAFF